MNPFDLRGPEFLVFYLVLAAGLIAGLVALRRYLESGPLPESSEPDPYRIAYLRGGANEAARVAILSLVDRGLLLQDEGKLVAAAGAAVQVRRPMEKEVLARFSAPAKSEKIFHYASKSSAAQELARECASQRLIPTTEQIVARIFFGATVVGLLWNIASHKIAIARARGHHNVEFLSILQSIIVPLAVMYALRSRTTPVGRRVLDDFKLLFSRLLERSHRIAPGGSTNELTLLLAVYGFQALHGMALLDTARELFPKAAQQRGSASGGCGSSCGGGCGSGCGGGGCGGGCGGCGS